MGALDLAVELEGLSLENPIIAASGTFGFGEEFMPFGGIDAAGAVVLKSVTLHPREGNPPPRLWETAAGLLNSIGLQNPGVDKLLSEVLPRLEGIKPPIVGSAAGESVSEYVEVARRLASFAQIAAVEVNASCPNVERGGMEFGKDPKMLSELTRAVKGAVGEKPLWVKLPPLVTDIAELARAAERAGANAVVVANTFPAMAVDPQTFEPRLGGNFGGLSGPAIKPIVLRLVFEVARAVSIPVIASGGALRGEDVAEFMLVGARAVQVGTANLLDPTAIPRMVGELRRYLERVGVRRARDLVGRVRLRG
ncbi:MAG TPA: dihydroorotate dehydrogenase [Armatimonadetes bacterium]|nr:dihydroorotate dehydrogenase [Armatimonadota bacterium]